MINFIQHNPIHAISMQYNGFNAQEIIDFIGEDIAEYHEPTKTITIYRNSSVYSFLEPGDYVVRNKAGWPRGYKADEYMYLFDELNLPEDIEWKQEWNEIPSKFI